MKINIRSLNVEKLLPLILTYFNIILTYFYSCMIIKIFPLVVQMMNLDFLVFFHVTEHSGRQILIEKKHDLTRAFVLNHGHVSGRKLNWFGEMMFHVFLTTDIPNLVASLESIFNVDRFSNASAHWFKNYDCLCFKTNGIMVNANIINTKIFNANI